MSIPSTADDSLSPKCLECGADIKPTAKFCLQCGASQTKAAPATIKCVACGADITPTAKICEECGASQPESRINLKRRNVKEIIASLLFGCCCAVAYAQGRPNTHERVCNAFWINGPVKAFGQDLMVHFYPHGKPGVPIGENDLLITFHLRGKEKDIEWEGVFRQYMPGYWKDPYSSSYMPRIDDGYVLVERANTYDIHIDWVPGKEPLWAKYGVDWSGHCVNEGGSLEWLFPKHGPEENGEDGLYNVGGNVSAPVVLNYVKAEFSDEALQAKYQGTCIISLIVDAQGNPQEPRVARALGLGLDEKVL